MPFGDNDTRFTRRTIARKKEDRHGILDRIAMVIRSNLNALINQAEDPEKMLDQILIDMRQQLQEAKQEVAAAIADERRLAAQLEAARAQVIDGTAVRSWPWSGEDDLAREALRRKAEQQQLAAGYQSQWSAWRHHQPETGIAGIE